MKLHTYELLRNSFRPTSEIRVLRTYWRQRSEQVHTAAECVQRMQKALTQMNLQLANVITDIMGLTGQKILRAILAGERDADKLAEMRNWRIQASHEEIVASLTGNWRPELLFTLKQEVDRYDFCQRQMGECDQEIEKQTERLAVAASGDGPPVESAAPPKKRKKAQGNSPEFDLGKNWCESRFGTWWDLGEQTRQFGFCRGALTLDCLILDCLIKVAAFRSPDRGPGKDVPARYWSCER